MSKKIIKHRKKTEKNVQVLAEVKLKQGIVVFNGEEEYL